MNQRMIKNFGRVFNFAKVFLHPLQNPISNAANAITKGINR